MTKDEYFAPFRHDGTNWTFSERDANGENPIFIADGEFRKTYSGIPVQSPDVLVSIGTGLSKNTSRTRRDSKFSTKAFLRSHLGSNTGRPLDSGGILTSTGPEAMWDSYLSSLHDAHIPLGRFIRLTPTLDQLPEYDDLSSLKGLRGLVRSRIDSAAIGKLASHLFATLFYYEKSEVAEDPSSDKINVVGEILECFQD
jgi:hypothetical protein